jgi:hypothetical protein
MKTTRNVLLALLLAGSTAGIASAQISISAGIQIGSGGRAAVDLGFFYDNLASYGNWIERPSYGWVWTPRDVSTNWRPYQDGHWVWTDQGWTWISEEPYGWATYHYGRWYQDPEIGWSWVPGNDWAPAWVDWQEGNDYVGWAPLPPSYDISASYDSGYGDGYYDNSYDNGYDNGYAGSYGGGYNRYGILASSYVFVQERYILAPRIVQYVVPVQQVVTILPRTRSFTHYRREGDRFINQGIPVDRVQQVIGRPVPRYQIADMRSGYQQRAARIEGNRLEIFRPQVRQVQVAPPVSRPVARQAVVSAQQFQVAHPNRAQRFQRENPQAVGQTPPGQRRNVQPGRGQLQGDPGRQVQGGQPDRQGRQYNNGQQPQDRRQVRPYDPQQPDPNQAGRQQRQTDAQRQQQLDRANRQRQYDPQRQDQVQPDRQRQNDAQRQQQQDRANRRRQYDPQQQDQVQPDRQRQNDAQRQQQQQDQANRQRQQDAQQQDRANRQRQYDPQRQDQGQADRQRQNDAQRQQQQERARQRQDDPQRPPQAEQRQPPPNRNGDNQGQTQEQRNQARKQREQERKKNREQNQDQNQDDHRPPQRR